VARPAVPTARTDCLCGTRIIRAAGGLILDYEPSPFGTIAAFHQASGAWTTRVLGQGQEPVPPEKRYQLHNCPDRP
jgi:hypothetical protein